MSDPFDRLELDGEEAEQLRLYRRLWLSRVDMLEAQATIDELIRQEIPFPRRDRPTPLHMSLTTALVVAYSRPFINSRGEREFADRTVPGSILKRLTRRQRAYHDELLDIRNKEIAHMDAVETELALKIYPDGEAAVLRGPREPFVRQDLRVIRALTVKIVKEIELRCEVLRYALPHHVWL